MTTRVAKKLAYWFIFQNDHLLVTADHMPPVLTASDLSSLHPGLSQHHLLSNIDEHPVYSAELTAIHPLPNTLVALPLKKVLGLLPANWYAVAVKAYAIINWDKNHRFCGHCGAITLHKPNTFERICTVCTLTFYPRISPSMIVLIHKDDHILMARSPHFTPGVYGLIAGFVEAGESIEDAVYREVREEVNLQIQALRYFGSQAWPFPDSLMIGFIAEYAAGEIVIDKNEIETAGWYHFNNLPGRPANRVSIASKLIDYFIASRTTDKGH